MAIYGAPETQVLNSGFGGFGGFGGGYGYPLPYPIPCGGYGGGYGGNCGGFGFGGLGEALVLGALVGGNGFLGNNRCCDHKGNDGHCHHSETVILDDAHFNALQGSINTLGLNISDKFAGTNAAIANVNYNQAINTKDIIHDIDIQACKTNANIAETKFELSKQLSDCCCELKTEGLRNTQVILDKLCQSEIQSLRDRLCRCEKDNDLFRLSTIVAQTAVTNGSNFNTGTQTQSTNSGQQVGV